jgi:uncharacterized protein (TIGR04255 family)
MSKSKLKNAPLKEVIFELFWEGELNQMGFPIDIGFDLAQGKFADRLKSTFPLHRKVIPDGAPVQVFGSPLHQYWKGEFQWPVVQHGPGMIAINDTEVGYVWEDLYKPTLIHTIEALCDSYEYPLPFNRAKLQYIDAYDIADGDVKKFIEHNLRTQVTTQYPQPGQLINLQLFQSFVLENGSEMQLKISSGINNKNQMPSVIWTTAVQKATNFSPPELFQWLDEAHTATSDMFRTMLNPDFYASLD